MTATINFRFLQQSFELDLEPNSAIYEAKIKIGTKLQIPPNQINLIFKGTNLGDSKRFSDLHITSRDQIQVVAKKPSTPTETKQASKPKHCTPFFSQRAIYSEPVRFEHNTLPPRRCSLVAKKSEDPPHFPKLLEQLMDMGFNKEECKKALRASFYNVNRAALYLAENKIPSECCNDLFALQKQRDELCVDHAPNQTQFVETQFEDLTAGEKNAIFKLERMGYDREIVIQVYFACDRNETVAETCLASFDS